MTLLMTNTDRKKFEYYSSLSPDDISEEWFNLSSSSSSEEEEAVEEKGEMATVILPVDLEGGLGGVELGQ